MARSDGYNTKTRQLILDYLINNRQHAVSASNILEHLEILDAALAGDWDRAADSLQHHLELARDKAEGVIKVIRLW